MGRPSRLEQIAAAVVSLLIVWQTLPEHQRKLLAMRALDFSHRLLARWAKSEGRAGMTDELAGRPGYAERQYAVTLKLSVARDRVAAALESMRP